MTEPRFRNLQRVLIRHGVAARHARRAALEMGEHFHALRREALARGEPPDQAARSAHRALGADRVLVERYAARRELRGWLYRWPALYAVVPLVSFAALCALLMSALVALLNGVHLLLHGYTVPAPVAAAVNAALAVFLLWVLPVGVAGGFALLASRRPVALSWLLASTLLLCLTARLMNAGLMLPVPAHRGSASLGIGFSSSHFPHELSAALVTAALALLPYVLATHGSRSRRSLPA
ncbi:MAG: hypothetical protein ACYCT1_18705 [Steroidobacteraceae bacterium]